jgi:hypothetical protein
VAVAVFTLENLKRQTKLSELNGPKGAAHAAWLIRDAERRGLQLTWDGDRLEYLDMGIGMARDLKVL